MKKTGATQAPKSEAPAGISLGVSGKPVQAGIPGVKRVPSASRQQPPSATSTTKPTKKQISASAMLDAENKKMEEKLKAVQ